MRSFFKVKLAVFARRYFFLYFSNYSNLIKLQLKLSTTATLGTSKKVAIVERLKEEWQYGPSAKRKGPCREVTVKGEVAVSSEVRLNTTSIFSGIWNLNCNKLYYQTQLYWLKSMRQYYWVLKAIVFAATDMPFFENCRKVASYFFAWTLLTEFSFQRHF